MSNNDNVIELLSESDDEKDIQRKVIGTARHVKEIIEVEDHSSTESYTISDGVEVTVSSNAPKSDDERNGYLHTVENVGLSLNTSAVVEKSQSLKHYSQSEHEKSENVIFKSNDVLEQKHPHILIGKKNDTVVSDKSTSVINNPYKKKRKTSKTECIITNKETSPKRNQKKRSEKGRLKSPYQKNLQAGLVFEEDVTHIRLDQGIYCDKSNISNSNCNGKEEYRDPESFLSLDSYAQYQHETRIVHQLPVILYHDPDFVAGSPASIDGVHKIISTSKKSSHAHTTEKVESLSISHPKCRCSPPKQCTLAYSSKEGVNNGRPYHRCPNNCCKYFSWAFTSYMLHWYRFGSHNGHILVNPNRGFRAEDLVQGKVGDCWFLSALAVVAEREDLIRRIIGSYGVKSNNSVSVGATIPHTFDNFGLIEVTLFVDGFWKKIVIDNFLPCIINEQVEKKEEKEVQLAIEQSLLDSTFDVTSSDMKCQADVTRKKRHERYSSSRFDSNAIADECRSTLSNINEFLHQDRLSKDNSYRNLSLGLSTSERSYTLNRKVSSSDLAYSKGKFNQLWVPFLEKAYAKMHGSYQAISGGHISEAFLDLTGAPTAVFNFDHHDFNARTFWNDLMSFKEKKLPMGCATTTSQEGIIGMHAYSILDVKEVKGIEDEFFYDKMAQGTLGNVSGYTDLDGIVRLLRIRNPHGQGEWKGEFSDKSSVWKRLLMKKKLYNESFVISSELQKPMTVYDVTVPATPDLQRTMVNDGTFWISYDDFLMAFSNVDVVLAFQGNHAKSFASNFPSKPSPHRCSRSFEIRVVGIQPGEEEPNAHMAEVYIMGIQKTRRGAYHGRADRKKSYKTCDLGILVGETLLDPENQDDIEFNTVDGKFLGLTRNGHIRLLLDRRNQRKKMIVMPINFGHPSATDEEMSFVIRFISDSPLLVRELATMPKLNVALSKFCFGSKIMSLGVVGTSSNRGIQGSRSLLLEYSRGITYLYRIFRIDFLARGGGTVLVYLIVNDSCYSQINPSTKSEAISFNLEINCRGMVCRTAHGLEKHEVISKGKKFEAAWRRFTLEMKSESKSRLLAAVVQSGQDYQMGSIKCNIASPSEIMDQSKSNFSKGNPENANWFGNYEACGIFTSVDTTSTFNYSENFEQSHQSDDVTDVELLDPDLSYVLQKSREDYENQLKLTDRSAVPISAELHATFSDEDIKRAIALSLK